MTTDGSGGSSSTTGAEPAVRRVFVTAAAFTGDLAQLGGGGDGPGGADELCSEAATTAGLDGSWVAWVSTSRVDALTRLPPDITWTLVDGATLVFTGRAAIQFGPEHAIDRTEAGDVLPSGTTVWTNTDAFGRNATAGQSDACADWTAQTGVAAVGVLIDASLDGTMGLSWTDTGLPQGCGGAHHLYCFQQ